MKRALTAAACLAAVTLRGALAAATGFVDPLDRPAEPSALATRRLLTGVAASGGRLVAVGPRGHALWSDDGGASWTQAPVPVSTDLTAVHLVSRERGWAVGHDGVVLATADGGRSWVKQLDGRAVGALLVAWSAHAEEGRAALPGQARLMAAQAPDLPFLDVWFADERTGFAVGAFNLILRTDDGGRSWTPWLDRTDNPRGLSLHAIRRVAGKVWIVGELGLVLRLDPRRGRFEAVRVPYGGSFFGVIGSDRIVVACGLRGNAFRTTDRGATWRRVDTGAGAALTGAAVMPDGRMVLVTQAGEVLESDDAGESFRPAASGRGPPASAAAPAGADALAIVGAGGVRVERLRSASAEGRR